MKKSQILQKLEESREAFLDVLDTIPETDSQTETISDGWNLQDILTHLNHWEAELIKFLWTINQRKDFHRLALDDRFLKSDHSQIQITDPRRRPFAQVLEDFHAVRNQTILRVEDLPEEKINSNVRGLTTGFKPLYEWIAELSYDHEKDHAQAIRNWLVHFQKNENDLSPNGSGIPIDAN